MHLPKIPHGWRDLAKEIGVIVIGVLIALGLEQVVEAIHWRNAVGEAREAIHDEMTDNASYFADRLGASRCLAAQAEAVTGILETAAKTGRKPAVSDLGPAAARLIQSAQWDVERSAQTIVHFPAAERSDLAAYYDQLGDMRNWRDESAVIWDRIKALNGPARSMSTDEIAQVRIDLLRVRHLMILFEHNADLLLTWSAKLGVARPPADQAWIGGNCAMPRFADVPA